MGEQVTRFRNETEAGRPQSLSLLDQRTRTVESGVETNSANRLSDAEQSLFGLFVRGDTGNLSAVKILKTISPELLPIDKDLAEDVVTALNESAGRKLGYELPFGKRRSMEFLSIRIDNKERKVLIEGQKVKLNPNEFRVLALLVERQGGLVDKVSLYVNSRKTTDNPSESEIAKCIRDDIYRLRKKIGLVTNRVIIGNEWGQGFRLEETDGVGSNGHKTTFENGDHL